MYIAATPLEGMERVDSLLQALGRSAQKLAALHTMTIIEEIVDGEADDKVPMLPTWQTAALHGKSFNKQVWLLPAIHYLRAHATVCTVPQAYTLFDFLPVNATSPMTAAFLLAGGKRPGLNRERQLSRMPAYRHQALIGEAIVPQVFFGHMSWTVLQDVQCIIRPMSMGTPHGLFL